MADKVESLLERMIDEFTYYKEETLFSGKEITQIVKKRKSDEYSMQRKDADVAMFLDSIKYEQRLEKIKLKRMKKQRRAQREAGINKKQTQFREENCIRRRIMYLYSRACRKYRQNKLLWREYLHYLLEQKSLQKLNKVLSECLQQMPGEVDFWLIGAYAELELKGNMFSSRQLILQGLRMNDGDVRFHLEYLRFEVKYFDKVLQRREVLQQGQVDFVNDCEVEGETKQGEEANIVKIVWSNIKSRFANDSVVLREAKQILKQSKYLRQHYAELLDEASGLVREIKMTEAGQLSLLANLTKEQISALPLDKVQRIVLRAKGAARAVLTEKLKSRSDCLAQVLSLCESEQARLQLLWKCNEPDFSTIKDHSSLQFIATKYHRNQSQIGKQVLQALEKSLALYQKGDLFTQKCFVAVKYQIIREMAISRTDLALKYTRDTLLKHVSEPQVLTLLIQKVIKSAISISDILGLTRQAGVRLASKAYLNLLARAKDQQTACSIYEQWASQEPTDESVWVSYILYLRQQKNESAIPRVKERALAAVTSQSQLMQL